MGVYLTDLSNQIYLELNQPSDLSLPEISFWLRSNISKLNILLYTDFTIDSTTQEVSSFDDFTIDEANILSKLYEIKYCDKKARDNLGSLSVDMVLEYSSDGTTIRKANRNSISQTYLSLRKELQQEAKDMISSFRIKKAVPKDISGQEILLLVSDNTPKYNRVL